jgi:hypothetical protein
MEYSAGKADAFFCLRIDFITLFSGSTISAAASRA